MVRGFTSNLAQNAEVFAIDSDSIVWSQTNGPPGGWVSQLLQNPYNHNQLFMVSGSGLVYKSSDKGESWKLLTELQGLFVDSIAPFEEGVFVGGRFGLKYLKW